MSRACLSVLALVLLAGCDWGPFKKDETPPPAPTATPRPRPRLTPPPPAATPTPEAETIEVEPLEADEPSWREEREAGPRASKYVRLPVPVRHGKERVPAGRYEVQLDTSGQDPTIVLLSDGVEVVRSLAVRPVKPPTRRVDGSWLWKDTREETLIRIFSQRGSDLYFAVFEVEE